MKLLCPFCGAPLKCEGGPVSGWYYSPVCGACFSQHELVEPPQRPGVGVEVQPAPVAPRSALTLICRDGRGHPLRARVARVVIDSHDRPFVEFPCAGCGGYVSRALEERRAPRLVALGLQVAFVAAPAEVVEIRHVPPVAYRAVEIHVLLAGWDWLERLEHELAGLA